MYPFTDRKAWTRGSEVPVDHKRQPFSFVLVTDHNTFLNIQCTIKISIQSKNVASL